MENSPTKITIVKNMRRPTLSPPPIPKKTNSTNSEDLAPKTTPHGSNTKFKNKAITVKNIIGLKEPLENSALGDSSLKKITRSAPPLSPIAKKPSPTSSDLECVSLVNTLEENDTEEGINPKNVKPSEPTRKMPPRKFNIKFGEDSVTVKGKANRLEEVLKYAALRGLRQPLNDKIPKSSTAILNTEPATTMEGSEPLEKAPIISKQFKKPFLPHKYETIADSLDKLLLNKETSRDFEEKIQHLKIPAKRPPMPLPQDDFPITKAKLIDENRTTNVTSCTSEPFSKRLTRQEPIYEEIDDIKKEDESKALLNASNNTINKTNKIMDEHDRCTLGNTLELAVGNTKPASEKPLQIVNDLNHLNSPETKSAGIRQPNQIKNLPDKEECSPELAFIIQDLRDKEIIYITQLENALDISKDLEQKTVPQSTRHKLFGYFQEIQSFHKEIFLGELHRSETPKQFALCFVKNFLQFNLYIKREWLCSSSFWHSGSFDNLLIESYNLKPYINLTTRRLSEYARSLQCFQALCEKDKDLDNRVAAEEAIKIIQNLEYQIQMVHQFKKFFGETSNDLKECGQVRLIEKFKISINGSSKKMNLLVYLCENSIIFVDNQNKNLYKCIDVLSTSLTYCCVLKQKHKFEVGIRGRKTFNLSAETQSVKDQWCKELKKIIKKEVYEDL